MAAYVSAGYAKAGARQNGARLMTNDDISARITELKTAVSNGFLANEIQKRTWRVHQLQALVDDLLALRAARSVLYGDERGEDVEFEVTSPAEEASAILDGWRPRELPPAPPEAPPYPKTMVQPGHPIGGATGMLVKDYRGKNAERVIWKFDGGLVARILDVLKQAAIEEGQWGEKQDHGANGSEIVPMTMNVVFVPARPQLPKGVGNPTGVTPLTIDGSLPQERATNSK